MCSSLARCFRDAVLKRKVGTSEVSFQIILVNPIDVLTGRKRKRNVTEASMIIDSEFQDVCGLLQLWSGGLFSCSSLLRLNAVNLRR
jgi:hypothetical protein